MECNALKLYQTYVCPPKINVVQFQRNIIDIETNIFKTNTSSVISILFAFNYLTGNSSSLSRTISRETLQTRAISIVTKKKKINK